MSIPVGFAVGTGVSRNLIQGTKIGTDVTGNVALFSGYQGIYFESAVTNTIGGAVPGAGNLISANNRSGIYLTKAWWNIIQGNLIGTKSDGVTALGNLLHALDCRPGSCNNTIGGTDAGAGNRLAFSRTYSGSGYAGARIRSGSTNNAFSETPSFPMTVWVLIWAPLASARTSPAAGATAPLPTWRRTSPY